MKIITKIEVAQVPKLFVPKRVAAYCRVSTLQEKQLHNVIVFYNEKWDSFINNGDLNSLSYYDIISVKTHQKPHG